MYRTNVFAAPPASSRVRGVASGPIGQSRYGNDGRSPPAIRGCTRAPVVATRPLWHSPPRSADFGDAVTIPAGEVPVFWPAASRHSSP